MTGRLPDGSYDFTGQQRQGGSTVYEAARPERSRRVLNNPLRYTDPTGTMWMDAALLPLRLRAILYCRVV